MQSARAPLAPSERQSVLSDSMVTMNAITAMPIVLLLVLAAVVAAPTLAALLELWSSRDDYSHGYLVPVISAYLAWNNREALFKCPLRPARLLGLAVVGLSGVALVLSQLGAMVTPGGVALVGVILGIVLLIAGLEWARHLLLPIGYLLLCVPVLDSVITPLHWPFQLLTAEMSTKALQSLGVPAFLEGNYISIPEITMEVATQCSGASLLIAVVAIGIPLAYVNLRLWWTRLGLLVFGVAVAIVANWARVTVIGLYAHMGGKELHGPMHVFQGLSVAWVGFIGLFAGAWFLGRLEERRGVILAVSASGPAWAGYRFPETQRDRAGQAGWLGVVAMAGLAAVMYGFTPMPSALRQEFSLFPYEIGAWRGQGVSNEAAFMRVPEADAELVREYPARAGGGRIQLYVAYFESQGQGREIVNDRTGHLHQKTERVPLRADGSLTVNSGKVDLKGGSRQVVFWYEDNGRVNADRRWAKVSTMLNGVLARRTNGALVLISAPAQSEEQAVRQELEEFARTVYPVLRGYLP